VTESFEQIAAHNEELARDIVERAIVRGVTVSTAESLTAGMVASTIADIPGASAVLRGGNLIVTAEGIRDTVRQVMLPV